MAFLLSGSPRPDSGIEGATESGFTTGSSASLENKSKLPLPRIPNPSLQWPNISTGITVQPFVITSLESAPVKATVAMLNMTLNQKKLNPYKFPTPIPLSHTRRAARLPADCIAAHIGIKPVKSPISVDLYERSLQRWSDQDLDDLIALL
ncbi:hypothetical protein BDF19DRAFT_447191 [Syncephalis fuscata]|nr:hypothetical protein BDF19DRAFT_447191 [Syncephalis fuscata]